ncbi:hypothetical protein [Legionella parisiensis]|uniref:Uncharacterized protein n=1 Tax=Legionella parisiensis TaxID=45071 RepID=A0A1E5JSY0_9GAMM|nr:hypothetical protein [Legionella parisiensis]KTD40300.1 hypothetical protein Lpar_1617 [Legionella parisiensis]OEH47634.1 hypothetical protein lpari_01309 [Legionella parisiensis]STX77268.1 Uncharacterised protein [Legionella parisiensis]
MKSQKELFEFLCELIDIQIKKYFSLAKFGVGPDARLNAKLVLDEVNELLEFAGQLIEDLENPQQGTATQEHFTSLFSQTKFYIEQEYVRAYAGWLLSENNIHSEVKERVEEQLHRIKQIGESAQIDSAIPSKPLTDIQKQCEHDSSAIAFRILDLAKSVKENPEMELPNNIPLHARIILKKNATTRYCAQEIAKPIEELHKKYDNFLRQSELEKSSSLLLKEDAESHQKKHKEKWENLYNRYKSIEPSSQLFSPDHEWYKVALPEKKKSETGYSSRNLMLFSGVVITGVVAISMLISYFMQLDDENSLGSVLKL